MYNKSQARGATCDALTRGLKGGPDPPFLAVGLLESNASVRPNGRLEVKVPSFESRVGVSIA